MEAYLTLWKEAKKTAHTKIRAAEYTLGEEIANGITHGVGAALSIAALVLLVVFASRYQDALRIV